MKYAALAFGLPLLLAFGATAQEPRPLVRSGETLTYRVHSARFGNVGSAVMRVEPDTVRGKAAFRLSFDFKARIMLFSVKVQTRSWVDAQSLTTVRFTKAERSPLGRRDEIVDVLTELGVWVSSDRQHPLAAPDPLDELSFIYYVRGLNLNAAARSERHFDPARNPVQLQLVGQERVTALGAEHDATVIRMDVKDPRQKTGQGTLRFYIGADAARLPLRIDSSMPMAGALTLTLQSVTVNERVAIVHPRGKRAQQ